MHNRVPRMILSAGLILNLATTVVADKKLRSVLEDKHASGTDTWIYNDIAAGFEQAKATGKPLFITFRCVPCENCEAFDAEVAQGSDRIARIAKRDFVSVRQVEMKNVDLSRFQFDYDLSWSAMFLNADGTIYARYGTQSAQGADAYNSTEGLEKTMQRVLAWHADYPQNAALFRGKTGKPRKYSSALDMPKMHEAEKRRTQATTRKNCIHCHNIHDAEHDEAYANGTFSQKLLWRYPLPENMGLTIDPIEGNLIREVEETSAAFAAGLRKGMKIEQLNGQAIASIADMQWVLHNLPDTAESVKITKPDGKTHSVGLANEWKKTDISWRGSLWTVRPRLRVWMPPLEDKKKRQAKLDKDTPALEVRWINNGSKAGKAAIQAGLRNRDIVLEYDGKPVPANNARFNMDLKLNYKIGDELPLTILRNGKRRTIRLRLVE